MQHGPSHAEVMWLEEEDQPCLVEVGARPHGGEGTFAELSTPGIGYNQLEATIWALVAPEKHRALPPRPGRLKVRLAWVCGWAGWVGALTALAVCVLGSVLGVGVGGGERRTENGPLPLLTQQLSPNTTTTRQQAHAREVTLVSREEGVLKGYPLLDRVRALPSFKSLEIKVQPGQRCVVWCCVVLLFFFFC